MILLVTIAVVFCVVYLYNKYDQTFKYWKRKGVAQLNPNYFYGDAKDFLDGKICEAENVMNYYKKFKAKGLRFGGVYYEGRPEWVPVDPELIKTITTKDYEFFDLHFSNIPKSLFFNNLFHMQGEEWRNMRRKLTPVFTTGKMKMMFDSLAEKADGLSVLMHDLVKKQKPIELKGISMRFTTDIIGSCGFGIECNSLKNEQSEFYVQGQKLFVNTSIKPTLLQKVARFLNLLPRRKSSFYVNLENFFREVVRETLKYREEKKVIRKDFMHLMIQLKNKGAITEINNADDDVYNKTVKEDGIGFEDIAGQVLLFFTAGFETSSTTMSFALLQLTQHPDIQAKMREEARRIFKKYGDKFTYEGVQEMIYIESVIRETLRMYPPLAILPRVCTKNYQVPNTDVIIEKGTSLKISVWGLHTDPEYFPNPLKFDPDRFSPENKHTINPHAYIPFGDGPRQCLGLRFALLESKLGLAVLLKDFNFSLHKSTPYPPSYVVNNFIPTVEGGVLLNVTKVD